MSANKDKYNSEPVWYCRECMSLAILNAGGHDYCRQCGSTDIAWAPIERWEWLYRNRFGHKFLETKPADKDRDK